MHHIKGKFNYGEFNDVKILELPYKGHDISMLILLPTQDITMFESPLTLQKLDKWRGNLQKTKLKPIKIPKFKFKSKLLLRKSLKSMGLNLCFDPKKADFSMMTPNSDLFVGNVVHQAEISVDEQGTTAVAATAFNMTSAKARNQPYFIADHPFIFVIQDQNVGNILFMGNLVDPTQL
ncbi:hypothetical protein WKT22_00147 [Candidatus Lokiarchaeum ossiferum]